MKPFLFLCYLSISQKEQSFSLSGHMAIMSYHYDGGSLVYVKVSEQSNDFVFALGIQISSKFIRENYGWVIR